MCICTVIRKYVTGGHVPSGPYRVYLAKEILGRILPCCCFTMKILRITNNIAAVNFPYYTLHCQHNISWRLQNLQKDYWDLDFLKISNKVSLFEEKKSLSWPRPGASGRAVWVRLWKGETSVGTCSIRENCQKESPPHFWSMCFIKFVDRSKANYAIGNVDKELGFRNIPAPCLGQNPHIFCRSLSKVPLQPWLIRTLRDFFYLFCT